MSSQIYRRGNTTTSEASTSLTDSTATSQNQVQAAINAGILNPNKPPVEQIKPEMYEINARSLPANAVDWHNLLPIAVTTLVEPTSSSDKDSKLLTTTPYLPHPQLTIRQRLNRTLGRSYIPSSTTRDTPNEYSEKQHFHDSMTIPSQVQVAVLIAMPSEYSSIPPLYELEPKEDSKGKRRDSSLHYDAIPDVTFGLSSLFVEPSSHTI
ncbi:hypothetical protein Clacol_002812 [Clathrus columnatus]|uniref:Uncharacterized protein n=1 Tax=Clathrus columnatus TaxID=1419009 RepID=A0AAV5A7H6_9AGAM|nr:hypothetical protein Clacol_002812 [Clathrus columnatus]